jgi:F-type H+-transporting ATPase subunit epsilon
MIDVMQFKVLLPTEVVVDEPVRKIVAEAGNGSFCLLPRHRDFLTAVVPGLLSFTTPDEVEHFLAVDEGILVKHGEVVLLSSRHAVRGLRLEELEMLVRERFEMLDDRERTARSAVAKLESDFVRRFLLLEKPRA